MRRKEGQVDSLIKSGLNCKSNELFYPADEKERVEAKEGGERERE